MRRLGTVLSVAALALILTAVPALAAHCVNHSKPDGAGNHGWIFLNASGEFLGVSSDLMNAGGRFTGGFIDVYVDFDGDLDRESHELVVEDTYLAANHSMKTGEPFVVPGAVHNPSDHGIGLSH